MDVERRVREVKDLTPAEQQLAQVLLDLGDRVQGLSIKEFAALANVSIATIHRFCKKLGLEGFKDLKVELARASERRRGRADVDINFPFEAGEDAASITRSMEQLYTSTLRETRDLLDPKELDRAAALVVNAAQVDIYTRSHNLYPAQMFRDRLISAGKLATCHLEGENQTRTALASGPEHVAIFISYSGALGYMRQNIVLLEEREVPIILIGTPRACQRNPGLTVYLPVSDSESFQHRITQFSSHIAVQYVLDALFACVFAADYDRSFAFLSASLPHTALPGVNDPE